MRQQTEKAFLSDSPHKGSGQSIRIGQILDIEPVFAIEAVRRQGIFKAIKSKPIYCRVSRIIRKFGSTRRCQIFVMALKPRRIPTVKGQVKFALEGTEFVRRGYHENAVPP